MSIYDTRHLKKERNDKMPIKILRTIKTITILGEETIEDSYTLIPDVLSEDDIAVINFKKEKIKDGEDIVIESFLFEVDFDEETIAELDIKDIEFKDKDK